VGRHHPDTTTTETRMNRFDRPIVMFNDYRLICKSARDWIVSYCGREIARVNSIRKARNVVWNDMGLPCHAIA
jgi:hypothetical protein